MRVLGIMSASLLAVTVSIAAHAGRPRSSVAPANSGSARIVLAWDDIGSRGHSGAFGGQRTAGHARQWAPPHWAPNRYYGGLGPYGGPGVPTYWVWGPSGGAFDYPFSDWRGPTGGWGNP
jgi:hypothetical protein